MAKANREKPMSECVSLLASTIEDALFKLQPKVREADLNKLRSEINAWLEADCDYITKGSDEFKDECLEFTINLIVALEIPDRETISLSEIAVRCLGSAHDLDRGNGNYDFDGTPETSACASGPYSHSLRSIPTGTTIALGKAYGTSVSAVILTAQGKRWPHVKRRELRAAEVRQLPQVVQEMYRRARKALKQQKGV